MPISLQKSGVRTVSLRAQLTLAAVLAFTFKPTGTSTRNRELRASSDRQIGVRQAVITTPEVDWIVLA